MATMSKQFLSGTAGNGMSVPDISNSSGSPTTVHTAVSGTSDIDEVWIYACNTDTSPVKLTLLWGGTTDSDDYIEVTIQPESGLVLVAPGLPLQNGKIVKAFCGTANVLNLHGYVNRITA